VSPPISDPNDRTAVFDPDPESSGAPAGGDGITVLAQLAKMVIQFGAIMLLARLVAPEAFGLVAMIVVVLVLFELCRDLGLSSATVHRAGVKHQDINALFWLGTGVSVAAFTTVAALTPALSAFYGREELTEIAVWLGASVLIGGLATQHLALLRRTRRFAALAATEICAAVAGIVTAVVIAMMDGGVWALVAQRLAWSATLLLAAWMQCSWRPGMPWGRADLRRLLGGRGKTTLLEAADLASRTLDHVLIGWMWGAAVLGLYERANRLLLVPVQRMNRPLMSVAASHLVKFRTRPQRYRQSYLRMFESVSMVSMPAAALIAAAPDWTVAVLLGPQWGGASGIVLWLGVAAFYQPTVNVSGWLLALRGRADDLARCTLTGAAVRVAAMVAGLPFGAVGVAAGFAVSGLLVHVPLAFWMAGRQGPVSVKDLYVATIPSVLAAAAVFATVGALRQIPGLASWDPFPALAAALCLGLAAALLCFAAFRRGRRALRHVPSMTSLLFGAEARP
jgi:polysaccharide transporter, PST family